MESFYEINVSQNGRHFFATAPRSAVTRDQAEKIVDTFRDKFSRTDGYQIEVTFWNATGHEVEI